MMLKIQPTIAMETVDIHIAFGTTCAALAVSSERWTACVRCVRFPVIVSKSKGVMITNQSNHIQKLPTNFINRVDLCGEFGRAYPARSQKCQEKCKYIVIPFCLIVALCEDLLDCIMSIPCADWQCDQESEESGCSQPGKDCAEVS